MDNAEIESLYALNTCKQRNAALLQPWAPCLIIKHEIMSETEPAEKQVFSHQFQYFAPCFCTAAEEHDSGVNRATSALPLPSLCEGAASQVDVC